MNEGRRGRKFRCRGRQNPCTFCGHRHGESIGGGRRWSKAECRKVQEARWAEKK